MARPHKGQHKIPKVYLEAFTNLKGLVWVADERLKLFSQKPKNILKERDYYTIRFSTGGGTLDVETKFLGGIESSYANIYRKKIKKCRQITKKEKAILAIFVASMMQRQPMRREALEKFFKDVEKSVKHLRGLPDKVKKRMATLPTSSSSESIPADDLLQMGKDVGSLHASLIPESVRDIAPIIFKMKWSFIVRPKDSNPFITSNNPCVIINPITEKKFGRGTFGSVPGFVQKDVEITLPLSSDISLLCGWRLKKDCAYMQIPKDMVDGINRRTKRHARTLISSEKEILETVIDNIKKYKKANL